jgi:cell division protein FtsB
MLRRIKRKFSISAPRLAVRPHVPWYVRWAMVVPFVLLAAVLVVWAYDSGLQMAGFHREQTESELAKLRQQVKYLHGENAKLNTQVVDDERQIQMERATNQELAKQLKTLNDEKAHLNEDLAFYQDLTQSGSRAEKLSINRLKVERDTLPGEYHCSMLLVDSGQRVRAFKGRLQLVANVLHNGEKSVLVFPQENSQDTTSYQLNFKYYQRVERSFQLPPGASLESLQVRVYEHGKSEPKIKQDVAPA